MQPQGSPDVRSYNIGTGGVAVKVDLPQRSHFGCAAYYEPEDRIYVIPTVDSASMYSISGKASGASLRQGVAGESRCILC